MLILSIAIFTSVTMAKAGTVTADSSSLSPLLTLYYSIKDALVAGNPISASASAAEFLKTINGIDIKTLPEPGRTAFISLNNKLAFDARHISESKEISHQREHFKSFSDNFYALAKEVKLSEQPVYQLYCPMKKRIG